MVVHASAEAVLQATGLGAHAAVAAALADQGRHVALSGVAEAQRAVDEDLDLDGRVFGDVADLFEIELPGEHGPRHAELGRGLDALEVVDGHLGAGVQRDVRQILADGGGETQILHEDRVRSGVTRELRGLERRLDLPVAHEGVERDVDLAAADAAIAHGLLKFFLGKVFGSAAGVEIAHAEIDRVGAVLYGGNDGFRRAGGGKQFCHGFSFGAEDRLFRIKSIKIQNTLYHKSPSCDKN